MVAAVALDVLMHWGDGLAAQRGAVLHHEADHRVALRLLQFEEALLRTVGNQSLSSSFRSPFLGLLRYVSSSSLTVLITNRPNEPISNTALQIQEAN